MKFELSNLGLLDSASVELNKMTLICGLNNTGKTYITYAVHGFLRSWRQLLLSTMFNELMSVLGRAPAEINLEEMFQGTINKHLDRLSKAYVKRLPAVFGADKSLFEGASIKVSVPQEIEFHSKEYRRSVKGGVKTSATISKAKGSPILRVLLAEESGGSLTDISSRNFGLVEFVSDAIADIVFAQYLPDVFIASAERTGAAIFRKELDFARTRLVEALGKTDKREWARNPFFFSEQLESGYAWPVQDNVDFVRQLEDMDKEESPLSSSHPHLLRAFDQLIGGSYRVIRGKGLHYQPRGAGKPKLTMSESSSSVRALLDVGFYLRCKAKPGDLLMIDEPELNLHPVNQRLLARLTAQLVNAGVKVFMTTHSDYIVKELNTLIMLNAKSAHTRTVQAKYQYEDAELLNAGDVSLFITCTQSASTSAPGRKAKMNTVRKAPVHPDEGIEVATFDETINLMNEIQTSILFGGEL